MGQLISQCTDGLEERKKVGALTDDNDNVESISRSVGGPSTSIIESVDNEDGAVNASTNDADHMARRTQLAEIERQLRDEQARLERIVSAAGRDMVAVSRRDGYYDPGRAARRAADLRQEQRSATFASGELSGKLPPSRLVVDDHQTIADLLTGNGNVPKAYIHNNNNGGVWGQITVARNDHHFMLDDFAESFLGYLLPTKEHLFQGTGHLVENLS